MNQQQKNYAMQRISEVRSTKYRDIEVKFTTSEVKLSSEEKYKLIINGTVKPFPLNHSGHYLEYGKVVYDFSKLEKSKSINHDAVKKALIPIDALVQKAKDQIMLGDCEEALKLIQELEAVKV